MNADAVDRLARAAGGDEHPAGRPASARGRGVGARPVRLRVVPRRCRPRESGLAGLQQPRGLGQTPDAVLASEASRPTVGLDDRRRRAARSVRRLACVAGCSYMRLFIAGAIRSGQPAASAQLLSRLSARPAASLAIVLAEAGAIRKTRRWRPAQVADRLVRRRRLVGEGAAGGIALELADEHGRAAERGERRPRRRSAGWWASARRAPHARRRSPGGSNSSALYAAMPPLTPSRIRDMATGSRSYGLRAASRASGAAPRLRALA